MPIVVPTVPETTAVQIIKRAMRLLGVLAEGETPSPQEIEDGLFALNGIMGSIANSAQMIYARTSDTLNLVSGQATYLVGPSGDLVTDRPVEVLEASTITYQGVTYPLTKWTLADYQQISVVNTGGIPTGFYAQMNMPDVSITFWPVPSEPMTFNLWSNKQITNFANQTQELNMPPGYDRALAFILAVEMAPEFEVEPSPNMMRLCAQSRRMLKRTNAEVPRLQMPYGIPNNNNYMDWRSM
jgi:hypothetical protein